MRASDPVVHELQGVLPALQPTRLISAEGLARRCGVHAVLVKAECDRPLGNFKVLGGVLAATRALRRHRGEGAQPRDAGQAGAETLLCASDGNHGLAVAFAAHSAGVPARVFLPRSVPEARAGRIAALGAVVERVEGTYDDAVSAASAAAGAGQGLLVSDTSDDPADPVIADVMAGYSVLSHEAKSQWVAAGHPVPSHVFVQAGVGGLAASIADALGPHLLPPRGFVVVESSRAACVGAALQAGRPVMVPGDLHTCADMLSCGIASAPALRALQRAGAQGLAVEEHELLQAAELMTQAVGVPVTPSAAAGLAGLVRVAADATLRARHSLSGDSTVLLVASERVPVPDMAPAAG